jgi:TPR repeat protein
VTHAGHSRALSLAFKINLSFLFVRENVFFVRVGVRGRLSLSSTCTLRLDSASSQYASLGPHGGLESARRGNTATTPRAMAFSYALLSRGRDTVLAANSGHARSQREVGAFHFISASRLDILEGASADDAMITARWSEALSFLERAAEQGGVDAQSKCGEIYAAGDRSVPQNWTAVKWWRMAAEAGREDAQWNMGVCYHYG